MERSAGVELGKVWDGMSWKERLEIVKTIVGYEKAFASASLPMYGSLYYAKDLPSPCSSQFLDPVSSIDKSEAFAIGPTTNRAFFHQGRDLVEVDRGPCKFHYLSGMPVTTEYYPGLSLAELFIPVPIESWHVSRNSRRILTNKGCSMVLTSIDRLNH